MSNAEVGKRATVVTRDAFDRKLTVLRGQRDRFLATITAAYSLAKELDAIGSGIVDSPKLCVFRRRAEKVEEVYRALMELETFQDLFASVIRNRDDIDPIEKFGHLRSVLHGTALALIKTFPFAGVYYATAWMEIYDYYNNPHILGFNY
ncbi:hypothetical protein J437_LFUL002440 [Ladona fulva]|uniref:Uncharacterized protein n=1 Tax=Ladona fulva TaxID=123851 RepID=A0A8K0P8G5_LADFU|nr:hypothetical protein J437_LFUL002440 [Ladona fulva]